MPKCIYENCIRVVGALSQYEACPQCRQRYKYWTGKSPAHRIERRRKLALSNETMAEFISPTKLGQFVKREYKKELKDAKK